MFDWIDSLWNWMQAHPGFAWWVGVSSAAAFLGTLLIVPTLLIWLPDDYFVRPPVNGPDRLWDRHPVLWLIARIAKNLLGALFVLLGLVLLVAPGQGVLTILLGMTLLDFPGKRGLELGLLRRPNVRRTVNWLRRRADRPPLKLPVRQRTRDTRPAE
jgi:hypothetical protein